MNNKTIGNIFKGDKVIWMIFFILCLVSIVEVFSASSFLTYKGGSYWYPIIKHTFFIFVGIIVSISESFKMLNHSSSFINPCYY